ncbi:MAG: TIGR01906 family membrane protein [Lachnospiraceae bacterium]|nr:TIGR01906 family membrane protein [Lachnospiraceae bacterium]
MKKSKHILFNTAMTVVLFLFILCVSIWAVLSFKPLYYWIIKLMKIPEETGYSFDVCKTNYDILIRYNQFFGPSTLRFTDDFVMSANGAYHFMEVKRIFTAAQITAMASAVLLVPGFIYAKKKNAWGFLKATIILTLAVLLFVGGALVIDGDAAFIAMHKILFTNDYWIFDPVKDSIINVLPEEFFLSCGGGILFLMAVLLVVCGLLYRKMNQKKRKKRK